MPIGLEVILPLAKSSLPIALDKDKQAHPACARKEPCNLWAH